MSTKEDQKKKGGCLQVLKVFAGIVVLSTVYVVFIADRPPSKTATLEAPLKKSTSPQKTILLPKDFDNCSYAFNLINDVSPLINKAVLMHNQKSTYQKIAEWRVETANNKIDELQENYYLPPSAFMNEEYSTAKTAYNDILYRTGAMISSLYSDSKNGYPEPSAMKEQYDFIKEGRLKVTSACKN